jgi:hypothetical protein
LLIPSDAFGALLQTGIQSLTQRRQDGGSTLDGEPKIRSNLFSPTIFHEPWWLEIASAGEYRETIVESGGRLAGRMPYLEKRRALRVRSLEMPALTYLLGPAILPEFTSHGAVRSLKEFNLTTKLVNALPPAWHVSFRLHAGINNALAFAAAGFQVSVDQSVEIPPAAEDLLWRQLRDKTRNMIRRASEQLTVRATASPGFFSSFYQECIGEAGKRNSYDTARMEALVAGASLREAGRVLVAERPDGAPVAAIFTVWDAGREYYLMSTRRRDAHAGAINLLLWKTLRDAGAAGRIFDMAGIHVLAPNMPNLVLVTGFGGTIVPRYRVARTHPVLREALVLSSLFSRKAES